ncbi:MAG: hypothetical protein GF398_05180 [Chitinivibrionales bacterium]|nr:hypothetical protein [Chitinivibrionales bacterium]
MPPKFNNSSKILSKATGIKCALVSASPLIIFTAGYQSCILLIILNVQQTDFLRHYRPVIRRRQRAIETDEAKKTMDAEDEIFEELRILEREIEKQDN